MQNSDCSIFRGSVDGKQKYCRILIRRKRASVEQALEFFRQCIPDLDEVAAEAEDEDKAEIRAMQACCVTAMEALIAQQKREDPETLRPGRWIPVTERLPENCDNVLAVVLCEEAWQVKMAWFSPACKVWIAYVGFAEYDIQVSHWMPLPEPPEEE